MPTVTETQDIGSSSVKWRNVYAKSFGAMSGTSISVTGDANIGGSLTVTGPSTFNGNVTTGTSSTVTISNTAASTSNSTGALQVKGGILALKASRFADNVVFVTTATHTGKVTFSEATAATQTGTTASATFAGGIYVAKASRFAGTIWVGGNVVGSGDGSFAGNLSVTGTGTIGSTLSVTGASTFNNDTTTTGVATFNGNVVINSSASADSLTVGSLVVSGNTSLINTANTSTLLPSSNNTYNIGSDALKYASIYATTLNGELNGNASSADKWKTPRTLTIGNKSNSVDGTGDKTWALQETLIRAGNEFNFTSDGMSSIWFNYRSQSGTNTGTKITTYNFGNGQTSTADVWVTAQGFQAKSIWAGLTTDTVECTSGVRSTAGIFKMFAQNNANGNRGIWVDAHGSDTSGKTVVQVDKDNNVNFYGYLNGEAQSSERTRYVVCLDTRADAIAPQDLTAITTGVRFDFKQKSITGLTASYSGIMSYRPYSSAGDWTGGPAHQVGFDENGLHWRKSTNSTTWGTWYDIFTLDKTLGTANGGTGATSFTANRLVRSQADGTLIAGHHYADASKVAIGQTSEPNYTFAVNGSTYIGGTLYLKGTTYTINGGTATLGSVTAYSATPFIANYASNPNGKIKFSTRAGTSTLSSTGTVTYETAAVDNWISIYTQTPCIKRTYAIAGDINSSCTTTYNSYPTRLWFKLYSYNNTNATKLTYNENYYLPAVTPNRTDNGSYDILTSKNTVTVAQGGTGKTSWTQWGVVYASASTTLTNTAAGTAGYLLQGNGAAAPDWVSPLTFMRVFSRSDVGTSPNFDNPGFNGFFEVRHSSETTGETGTRPFNGYAGMLTMKTSDNIAMLQLAGSDADGWWIRGGQGSNITLSGIVWQRLVVADSNSYDISITGNAATATKATQDGSGNTITNKYFQIYNTSYQGGSNSVTVNDLANQGPAYGMIYSATDNPIGSATWVHVLNLAWSKANTSWIGQIALHTDGSTMYFRGNGTSAISGKGWNTVLSSNNYSSYALPLSGGTLTGPLHIFPGNNGNWTEGIRIHAASDLWTSIVLCDSANTENNGTSANTWSIHNNEGNFYISRNGSSGSDSAIMQCVNNVWSFSGTVSANISGNAYSATTLAIDNTANRASCLQFMQRSDGVDSPSATWYQIIKMNHLTGDTYFKRTLAFEFWTHNIWTNLAVGDGNYSTWKKVWVEGNSVTSAVWNDYAEYRASACQDPGRVVFENGDDTLSATTKRLQHFAGVVSDTWGFAQGETAIAKTPLAVAGRVLVYTYRDRDLYQPGDCVCAAPGGTVDIMTREEIVMYPDRIVGTVSCVPTYEEWGSGDRPAVKVNNRIWIKVK